MLIGTCLQTEALFVRKRQHCGDDVLVLPPVDGTRRVDKALQGGEAEGVSQRRLLELCQLLDPLRGGLAHINESCMIMRHVV